MTFRVIQGGLQGDCPRRPSDARDLASDCYPYPGRCESGGVVYFVACRDDFGAIKIGYASDLGRRVSTLQNGCPHKLEALTCFWSDDPERDEYALHRRFSEHLIRGEWFAPAPEIVELILAIQDARRDGISAALGPEPLR